MFLRRIQLTSVEVCSPTAISCKPVHNHPQPSIPKLTVVYGQSPTETELCVELHNCCGSPAVWLSLWVFLESLNKSLNSSVAFGFFSNPKDTKQKPIIHCHYPRELQKVHIFLKALGCPTSFYYCFVTQLVQVWAPASTMCHGHVCAATSPASEFGASPTLLLKRSKLFALPTPACEGLSTWAALSHLRCS